MKVKSESMLERRGNQDSTRLAFYVKVQCGAQTTPQLEPSSAEHEYRRGSIYHPLARPCPQLSRKWLARCRRLRRPITLRYQWATRSPGRWFR